MLIVDSNKPPQTLFLSLPWTFSTIHTSSALDLNYHNLTLSITMASMLESRTRPSPDNYGPYVVITGYILMSIMILCIIAKIRPDRHTFHEMPRLDECLVLLATVRNFLSTTKSQGLIVCALLIVYLRSSQLLRMC